MLRFDVLMTIEHLTKRRLRVLDALSEIVLPAGGDFQPGARDLEITSSLGASLNGMPVRVRKRIGLLIDLVDRTPIFFWQFRRSFLRLNQQKREAWVSLVHESKSTIRKLPLLTLEQLLYLAFASTPEVEKHVGFDYTCRLDGEVHGAPKSPDLESDQ